MNKKTLCQIILLLWGMMKVLGQDYYPDNQTLIKKLEIETGKKELLWEWDSFFQERYEIYNKIYFKNMLKSLSTTYCIYEYFGGDVALEWSAIVLDINNGIIYKIHQNHIVRNELKCNLTNIINLNSKFNNSYIEGEIARGYSVSLITLVNNSEISWVLTGGSITSKFLTDNVKKNEDLSLRRALIKKLKALN